MLGLTDCPTTFFRDSDLSLASGSGFLSPRAPESKAERRVLIAILVISGAMLIVLGIYYLLNPREVVGDSLVTTPSGSPNELPPLGTFPFYAKPVTILFIALVAFGYSFFALIQRPIFDWLPRWLLSTFLVFAIIVFAMSAYETLFNFTLWSALLAKNPNPDLAVNVYPSDTWKVNLVFATKAFVSLLFVSFFAASAIKNSLDRGRI